jgi:hypothetical protein
MIDQPLGFLSAKLGLPMTDLQVLESSHKSPGEIIERSLMRFLTLSKVAGIKIGWVDTLNAHLDFDSSKKQLSAFRFPSFCLLSSRSEGPAIGER